MTPLLAASRSAAHPRASRSASTDAPAKHAKTAPAASLAPVAPAITATKTDSFPDPDGDGKAEPGQTITYAVTITNNGTTDATGVQFADSVDPNTTLIGSSVNVSPLARDDSYSTFGNTLLEVGVPAGSSPAVRVTGSAFDNDSEFFGDTFTLDSFQPASANGGTVSMNASGQFSYLPPAGFTGSDTFTYTIKDSAGLTSTTAVNLTVGTPRVWYVNNAGPNGDGRSTSPFNSLAPVNGAGGGGDSDSPGDIIFLYQGASAYTSGLQLEDNQQLIGQPAGLTVSSFVLATPSGTNPIITNASGNGITLAQSNTVSAVIVSGASGAGISGTGVNDATVNSNVIVSGSGGAELSLDGGNGTVNFAASVTNGAAGTAISIQNRTGGTVNASGAITANTGGTGISLTNNTGATINFSGGMNISTGANAAFTATGGGTVNVTGSPNTLATTTATALNITNTNIGASGANFRSISSNGAASGIVLNNTGAAGGLTVTGDGGASNNASGGTISNSTAAGVSLNATSSVSLGYMNIQGGQNDGVSGTNVVGFTLNRSNVTANGNAPGESGVEFTGLHGASSITNSSVSNSGETNIRVVNTTNNGSQATLNITGSTISNISANVFSDDGILYSAQGTANMSISVSGSTFTANRGDHFQATANDSASLSASLTTSTLSGGHSNALGQGILVNSGTTFSGSVIYDINGNTINGSILSAITATLGLSTAAANFTGRIRNNLVGTSGSALSCSAQASGIVVNTSGAGTHTSAVTGNAIRQCLDRGINVLANNGAGALNLTVQSNSVTELVDPISREGFMLNAGSVSTDSHFVCLQLGGAGALANNLNHGALTTDDYRVRQRFATTVKLPGYAGAGNDTTAVVNFINGNNTSSVDPISGSATTQSPGSFTGGSACAVPAFAMLDAESGQRDYLAKSGDELSPAQNAPATVEQHDGSATTKLVAASTDEMVNPSNARRQGYGKLDEHARLSGDRAGYASRAVGMNASSTSSGDATTNRAAATSPALTAVSGGTVTTSIGTLPAGRSITITFQATVNNPFPSATSSVSNQGTVSGSNFANVLTDDPTEPGTSDPTVTPIFQPSLSINDVIVAEPASGTTTATFTVTLSRAVSQTVTVAYQTADGTANAGSDYDATSGTVTFNPGETSKPVVVTINSDAADDPNETFFVNLSGATNATIFDAQGIGTITSAPAPGDLIISEFRFRGPDAGGNPFIQANNEYVELYNRTAHDIYVTTADGSNGWALVASDGVSRFVIPNGTRIPARGHYLAVNSNGYSLGGYPSGNDGTSATTANGDTTYTIDIADASGIALFRTDNNGNFTLANRLDAAGYASVADPLYREGAGFPAGTETSGGLQYTFYRDLKRGAPKDTDDNAADFISVDTNATAGLGLGQLLGAPGPENLTSPIGTIPCSVQNGTPLFPRTLLDTGATVSAAPNRVRDTTPVANGSLGTISFRRRFTNNTGSPVTRLRYRIVDLSTSPASSGAADLRALSSADQTVTLTNATTATVRGTTLEQPPAQTLGGGFNSSLSAGTVNLAAPLANGSGINLSFLFGVEQAGSYRFAVIVEALPTTGQDFWTVQGNTETLADVESGCNSVPVANAGADQTLECAGALTGATLDGTASTDADPADTLSYAWSEGATPLGTGATLNVALSLGSHTITLTVTDSNGASSQDTVVVNVVDTIAPTIDAPDNQSFNTGAGASACGVVVDESFLTATATDGCSSVNITRTGIPAGNLFPVGTTTVTYTATDSSGNSASATQTITVIDDTKPAITVPASQTVNTDSGVCSASVNAGTATATDNCGVASVAGARSDSQPLNAAYPKGTTTITWTATDIHGNVNTGVQTITVTDNENPNLTVPANKTASNDPGMCSANVNPGTATATDNCPGVNVTGTRSDSQSLSAPYPVGTTTITWTATDADGNTTSGTQTVTVNDTENPSIIAPINITASTDPNSCSATINVGAAAATDNCPGVSVTGTRGDNQPLNAPYPKGTTTITWKATDAAGNMTTGLQNVTVNDTQAPSLVVPPTVTVATGNTTSCSVFVSNVALGSPSATDNCAAPVITRSGVPAGNVFPVGTTIITYTATDASGNVTTGTQSVVVNDNTKPVITLIGSPVITVSCTTPFTDPGATATDNCTPNVTVNASSTVNPNQPGSYIITYTAFDAAGNAATPVTRTVNVVDTTAPVINVNAQAITLWPPNHQYITVNMSSLVTSATDGCDGSVDINDVVITKVTSDESENGNGDGNTSNDIVIAANCKSVQLRSERNGGGNGRVYTVTLRVRDASGNTKTATKKITVPKSQGNNGGAVEDAPQYTVNGSCP